MKNLKNELPKLNPYQIYWGIVEITEGVISKSLEKRLYQTKLFSFRSENQNVVCFHSSSDLIDERLQNILNIFALSGLSGRIYKITDKQFGMTKNNWNGIESETPKPFTRKVVHKDGNMISVIPLTEKQFNESMEF